MKQIEKNIFVVVNEYQYDGSNDVTVTAFSSLEAAQAAMNADVDSWLANNDFGVDTEINRTPDTVWVYEDWWYANNHITWRIQEVPVKD